MPEMKMIGEANHLLAISEVFVFITKDATGNEGIPAVQVGDMMMPMVCADIDRVESLRSFARQMAEDSGIEIKLVHFSERTELETIAPAKTKQ